MPAADVKPSVIIITINNYKYDNFFILYYLDYSILVRRCISVTKQ